MKLRSALVSIGLLLVSMPLKSHAFCFVQAGQLYGLDPHLLQAIATVETNLQNGVIGPKNANGTFDIGLMQINSAWLPSLEKRGITLESLKNDACLNVHVGAWILNDAIKTHGKTWRAIGAYNATNDRLRSIYVNKVRNAYYHVHLPTDVVTKEAVKKTTVPNTKTEKHDIYIVEAKGD